MQLDIFKCIASYLLQNESVAIQGLGSFRLKDINTDFLMDSDILHPPRKSVIFDQNGEEDIKFLGFLSQKLNLSVETAKSELQSFVNQLTLEINEHKSVNFPGIGTFSKKNKNIHFIAISTNFHPKYPYLPSIPLRKIASDTIVKHDKITSDEKIGKVSAIHKEEAQVLNEKLMASTRKESIMEETNQQPNPHYYDEDKGFFTAIGWPLFWLSLLGILFFLFMKKGCNVLSEGADTASEVVSDVANTASDVVDQATDAVTGGADTDGDIYSGKYSDVLTPEIIQQGCVIVVGAFKKTKNALRMRERIIAKGYQPYDEFHNGLNRVGLIFNCLDEDLIDFLQLIRRDIEPKAWYRIPGFEVAYEN